MFYAVVQVNLLENEYLVVEDECVNFCLFLGDEIDRDVHVNISTVDIGSASCKLTIVTSNIRFYLPTIYQKL